MVKISKLVIPIFIIGLMIFSVIAYSLTFIGSTSSSQQTSTYKGTKFTYSENSWIAQKDNQRIEVFNNPLYLEPIELDSTVTQAILESSKIYISSNPDDDLTEGTSFLRFILSNDLGKQLLELHLKIFQEQKANLLETKVEIKSHLSPRFTPGKKLKRQVAK